jgi:hypothetical protein
MCAECGCMMTENIMECVDRNLIDEAAKKAAKKKKK